MEKLEARLCEIETKLDRIIHILDTDVSTKCDKMGKHIDFIETVYDSVKHPLQFVCNQFAPDGPKPIADEASN